MSQGLSFAVNHMVAPRMSLDRLLGLAAALDLPAVEIRNDLAGVAIADGTPAADVRAAVAAAGRSILTINALQRFNEWTRGRAQEARALAAYARECGAAALVLCPVNSVDFRPAEGERLGMLREALAGLAPILADAGILGYVEPLGFAECSLRRKSEAVAAIDALGLSARFRLVHDTFHHHLAGEAALFPARTGIVHISGVEDPGLPPERMRDPHRVLVGPGDRIGNLAQIRALIDAGCQGPFSFEPFSPTIHGLDDVEQPLRESMRFIEAGLDAARRG